MNNMITYINIIHAERVCPKDMFFQCSGPFTKGSDLFMKDYIYLLRGVTLLKGAN